MMSHSFTIYRAYEEEFEGDEYVMQVQFYGVYNGEYELQIDNAMTPKQFCSSLRSFAEQIEQGIKHEWH